MSDRERIRAYYAQGNEWARLEGDEAWLEYARTLQYIDRYFQPGSRVLDLGGGPGRYTIAMAQRGHRVTMLDLSMEQVKEAQRRIQDAEVIDRIDGLVVGDARDLSQLPGQPFEAVLALGPLYHADGLDEIQGFVDQIAQVLTPGGVVIGAFIPRTSGVSGLIARAAEGTDQVMPGALAETFRTGRFQNAVDGRFGEAFFAHPAQIRTAFSTDFQEIGVFSLRGMGAGYGRQLLTLANQKPALFEEVMALIDETSDREDVIGLGWHAVFVGRRR
ncbi:MAG: class I SAM-dependent methyltransferase [Myxococcota bacterium]